MEYLHFVKLLKEEYSDILDVEEIGNTIYTNPIYKISFKENQANQSGILFTGVHHAREPISLLMNIYIILKFLYEIKNQNSDYLELIHTRNIYFIPLINIDGFEYNVILYDSIMMHQYGLVRKNRKNGKEFGDCDE